MRRSGDHDPRGRPRAARTLVSIVALSSLVTAGCEPGASPGTRGDATIRAPVVTAALRERGAALYARHCSGCHGETGRGDGTARYLLHPKPRDFSKGVFRLVSTASGNPTDADLFRTLSRGMPGSAMPPWDHLAADDRWALVAEVRRLSREGLVEALVVDARQQGRSLERAEAETMADEILAPGEPIAIPPEPEVTVDGLGRGRTIYLQQCAQCHDVDGRGRERRDLLDNDGHPLFARDFTRGIFKRSSEGSEIAYRILAGIPGTPMPSYRDTDFTDAELWALIHFIQSLVPERAQQLVAQSRREITVGRVSGPLDTDPAHPVWRDAAPIYLALMPLWWRDDRVEGVTVRALHDGERIALHLSWNDATQDRHSIRPQDFTDAVAVQLSTDADPPFFAMGQHDAEVTIWHWRAQWGSDLAEHTDIEHVYPRAVVDWYDSAIDPRYGEHVSVSELPATDMKPLFLSGWAAGNMASDPARNTSVESLSARGFGTLTTRAASEQTVSGDSRWDRNVWEVVLLRKLQLEGDDPVFTPGGAPLGVAFAVWDGSSADRNGQKSVTVWHSLRLER